MILCDMQKRNKEYQRVLHKRTNFDFYVGEPKNSAILLQQKHACMFSVAVLVLNALSDFISASLLCRKVFYKMLQFVLPCNFFKSTPLFEHHLI